MENEKSLTFQLLYGMGLLEYLADGCKALMKRSCSDVGTSDIEWNTLWYPNNYCLHTKSMKIINLAPYIINVLTGNSGFHG